MTACAWAAELDRAKVRAAGPLRLWPEIEVLLDGRKVWLRGSTIAEELERAVRKIPGAILYAVDSRKLLRRPGRRVPEGRLPGGKWMPFREALGFRVPTAAFSGALNERIELELVRSFHEKPAEVLLAEFPIWAEYALRAPEIRLGRLRFAVASDRRSVIVGRPLPPIRGRRFSAEGGVALPCGFSLSEPIGADVFVDLFGLSVGDLVLVGSDGTCERIAAESFVVATRSAIRVTREGIEGAESLP